MGTNGVQWGPTLAHTHVTPRPTATQWPPMAPVASCSLLWVHWVIGSTHEPLCSTNVVCSCGPTGGAWAVIIFMCTRPDTK